MAKEKATAGQKIKVWFEKYLLPCPLRAADKQANESESGNREDVAIFSVP